MKHRWIAMILVLSLAVNAAVIAVSGYNYYRKVRLSMTGVSPSPGKEHHFYQVLGLTQAQLVKIDPLAKSFHGRLENLHSVMGVKKDLLVSLLGQENVAHTEIEKLREEMAAIQDNIQRIVISHILDVKAILDSNQQERFLKLLHKSMHQEHGIFLRAGE
jgi:Spy/CpxP family protein refolding chaperone